MKLATTIIFLFFINISLFAGNGKDKEVESANSKSVSKTVFAKITNAFGEAIVGAKVMVKETEETFYTDFDGNFTISLKSDKIYSISVNTLGYQPLELKSTHFTQFSNFSLEALN